MAKVKEDEKKNVTTAAWDTRIGAFATAVGKTPEEVTEALEVVVGPPSDKALELLSKSNVASDEDIKVALAALKIPIAVFKESLAILRGPQTNTAVIPGIGILPSVPDDDVFLQSLKVGGELKVGQPEILSGIRACIAKRAGLYDVPDRIKKKMEAWADSQEIPYSDKYYEVRDIISEKNYAEVLSALKIKGTHVTETGRKEFLNRMETVLWPELKSFHMLLKEWYTTYSQNLNTNAIASLAQGLHGGSAHPLQVVDASGLRDAAEVVINGINKTYAGAGIPASRTLAADAIRIKKLLGDESILVATGAGTKDQLLRDLGIAVGADIIRTEMNMVQYTLAIMNLPKVETQDEANYLLALHNLGVSIPWEKFGVMIGSRENTL